jgi:hypothetical protein
MVFLTISLSDDGLLWAIIFLEGFSLYVWRVENVENRKKDIGFGKKLISKRNVN